jgi:hypothetical protein
MAFQVEMHNIVGGSGTPSVTLLYTPMNPSEVAVDPTGGPSQVYGADFTVSSNVLSWGALANSDIKKNMDLGFDIELRVMYER